MPTIFLLSSLAGLLLVLNARRALRVNVLLVPAFFGSWLVAELAPQLLLLHVVGVTVFVARGALEAWQGWAGLAGSAVVAVLLWGIAREAWRSHEILDGALDAAIGPDTEPQTLRIGAFAFPFKLWSRQVRRIRNVPYTEPGSRRFRLDVRYVDDNATGRPCFLYVPGGGWMVGVSNKDQQGKPMLVEMAKRGWLVFAMNYPVAPRRPFPAHIIAVKRAIAWIREHAHEYGGDPSFLMLSGNSAGGHLSSLAALTPNDPAYQPGFEDADTSVQAVAPMYGVYDFTGDAAEGFTPWERRHKKGSVAFLERVIVQRKMSTDRGVFEQGSPWHRIGAHAPPFFLIHGANDTLALVAEARAFADRLRAVSEQPVIYAELPHTQHAFDNFLSIRSVYAVRAIARFANWAATRSDAGSSPRPDRAVPGPTSQE